MSPALSTSEAGPQRSYQIALIVSVPLSNISSAVIRKIVPPARGGAPGPQGAHDLTRPDFSAQILVADPQESLDYPDP
jgi:hypothetical protein